LLIIKAACRLINIIQFSLTISYPIKDGKRIVSKDSTKYILYYTFCYPADAQSQWIITIFFIKQEKYKSSKGFPA